MLAAGTLVGFGGVGILVIFFVLDVPVRTFLAGSKPYYIQIPVGLLFGFISAKAAWAIVEQPFLKEVKNLFSGIFRRMDLGPMGILFISACAGIGEEILFRGAIQPMLGVWTTAMLFVFLHGYINPFNLPLSVYGIYMTVVIGVIGMMALHLGIISAIMAHFVIDYVLLLRLTEEKEEGTDVPEEPDPS